MIVPTVRLKKCQNDRARSNETQFDSLYLKFLETTNITVKLRSQGFILHGHQIIGFQSAIQLAAC